MHSITNMCFLCIRDYNCIPASEKVLSQVEYLLPEITIIKLGVPLRICSVCDGSLYSFNKFKQSCVESSRRLEASIKGAQGPSLFTDSPPFMDDNETSDAESEKSEESIIKEKYVEETPLDTQMHTDRAFMNPFVLLEKINVEQHNHRVSQNMHLHTDTNDDNIKDMIKKEQIEEIELESEFYGNTLMDDVSNSTNDDIESHPDHNTEEEFATFSTSEEDLRNSADSEEEAAEESDENIEIDTNIPKTENQDHLEGKIEKTHLCTICYKEFRHEYNFNLHMDIHNGIKNYSCSICYKMFLYKRNLELHIKSHIEQNKTPEFSCSVCNKEFYYKPKLQRHMKIHCLDDLKCKTCGKTFSRKNNLKIHMQIHTGVKEFQCKICKKSFFQKSYLTYHTKNHCGLKDYRCEICHKSFPLKPLLKSHMLVHYEMKDLKCKICGKSYSWKSALNRHMKSHYGLKQSSSDEEPKYKKSK